MILALLVLVTTHCPALLLACLCGRFSAATGGLWLIFSLGHCGNAWAQFVTVLHSPVHFWRHDHSLYSIMKNKTMLKIYESMK